MPYDLSSLDGGRCFRIEWPTEVSAEEIETILESVELFKRKLARFKKQTPETHTPDGAHVQVRGETVDGGAGTGSDATQAMAMEGERPNKC